MTRFEKKQQKLDNSEIQIKFYNNIKITSLSDIIHKLWFNSTNKCTQRYHKRHKKFIQQITGDLRSIDDFYLITKYYFGNLITYEQCYNSILLMYDLGYMDHHYCTTVRKRVNYCDIFPRPSSYEINKILNTKKLDFKL